MLDLKEELSVVLARGLDGQCAVFPVARNVHEQGILAVTTVDMQAAVMTERATQAALSIARGLKYEGVLCVEFFVLGDGQLLVNEIAPRPHNSGHFSMNACVTSQFEQQARVMAGLPLGSTRLLAPVVMLNILGDVWYPSANETQAEPNWAQVLAVPGASLHLYGKREARRARKMGHVNCTGKTIAEAVTHANQVVQVLRLPVAATL
jgi:5-(carboxyamino)imidazole ribonucleotide synthase